MSILRSISAKADAAFQACLRPLDIAVVRRSSLDNLHAHAQDLRNTLKDIRRKAFLDAMPEAQRGRLEEASKLSRSQNFQDLFALAELDFRRKGYFVEFGASGGTELSNTYLLEREFGWSGILAEPCRAWHDDLRTERRAHISTECVWSRSGETLTFKETRSPWLSTIDAFSASDHVAERRSSGRTYHVHTISLLDLLAQFQAPQEIDYLSIDTEGSEFEILRAFDFSKFCFRVITVEHNFTPAREKIRALLSSHGYARRNEVISDVDDWYALSPR
jgi:FkbM family methyltransferase